MFIKWFVRQICRSAKASLFRTWITKETPLKWSDNQKPISLSCSGGPICIIKFQFQPKKNFQNFDLWSGWLRQKIAQRNFVTGPKCIKFSGLPPETHRHLWLSVFWNQSNFFIFCPPYWVLSTIQCPLKKKMRVF